MKQIPLSRGRFALVDDKDYEMLNQYNWCVNNAPNTFYAKRRAKGNPQQTILMHKVLLVAPPGFEIDHIDGNGLNNQRSNLRVVTHRENLHNHHRKKTSRFVGVSWSKSNNNWQAQIHKNSIATHLGNFKTEEEAHEAYLKALNRKGDDYNDRT